MYFVPIACQYMLASCGANTHTLTTKRLRAAYNIAYRIMHMPRNVSVRPHPVSHRVTTFDTYLINNLYRFLRCASSSNFFIRSLQMSAAFYKSSFFLNYERTCMTVTN